MAMSYPNPGGYRPGSPGYRPGSQRRTLPRAPYSPPASPRLPPLPPMPSQGNAARMLGLGARGLSRLLGVLAIGYTAYEAWRWYDKNYGFAVPSGYHPIKEDATLGCTIFAAPVAGGPPVWQQQLTQQPNGCSTGGWGALTTTAPRPNFWDQLTVQGAPNFWARRQVWWKRNPLTNPATPGVPTDHIPRPNPVEIPQTSPVPAQDPWNEVPIIPPLMPWFDPFRQPIPGFMPAPLSPPWRVRPYRPRQRPDRDPKEQPDVGPAPAPRPLPGGSPVPGGSTAPRYRARGRERLDAQGNPELHPERRLAPRYHRIRPPGPGVKEKKFFWNASRTSPLGRIINGVTETDDFINCLHSGLPKDKQVRRGKGESTASLAYRRAQSIYRNVNDMNWMEAIKSCAINQAIDYAGGLVGKAQARANQKLGLTGGTVGRTAGNIRKLPQVR